MAGEEESMAWVWTATRGAGFMMFELCSKVLLFARSLETLRDADGSLIRLIILPTLTLEGAALEMPLKMAPTLAFFLPSLGTLVAFLGGMKIMYDVKLDGWK